MTTSPQLKATRARKKPNQQLAGAIVPVSLIYGRGVRMNRRAEDMAYAITHAKSMRIKASKGSHPRPFQNRQHFITWLQHLSEIQGMLCYRKNAGKHSFNSKSCR